MYQQIVCVDDDSSDGPPEPTSTELIVFVESDRVKAFDRVRFKETGTRWWKVRHVYQTRIDHVNR